MVVDLDNPGALDSGQFGPVTTIMTPPTEMTVQVRRQLARTVGVVILLFGGFLVPTFVAASTSHSGYETGSSASQTEPFAERDDDRERRVYDRVPIAGILTPAQVESLEGELERARGLGVEALVYARTSGDSAAESQAFADRLRIEWGVESVDARDDGIVYLITVNPAAPETNSIHISTGANTFPIRQLDQSTMQGILDNEMAPQIEEGEFNQALLFGVRRVLNHAEYSPPAPPDLSSWRNDFRFASNVLGAGLLQLAVIGYFLTPALRERRLTLLPSTRSLAIYAVVIGTLAVGTGIIAIAGRGTFGSLVSLGVAIWAGCIVPVLIGFLSRRRESHISTQYEPLDTGATRMIGQLNG